MRLYKMPESEETRGRAAESSPPPSPEAKHCCSLMTRSPAKSWKVKLARLPGYQDPVILASFF